MLGSTRSTVGWSQGEEEVWPAATCTDIGVAGNGAAECFKADLICAGELEAAGVRVKSSETGSGLQVRALEPAKKCKLATNES